MANALEVDPGELIERTAKKFAENKAFQPPVWAAYVKTGRHAERPPMRPDWWCVRVAAVLRSVYNLGPVGTSKLRTKYGGRKSRGYKPEHFYRGSGSVIRKVLQQLEKAGYISQVQKGVHKGRKVTKEGQSLLDQLASEILKEGPKQRKREIKLVNVKVEAAPIVQEAASSDEGDKLKKKKGK